MPLLFVSVCPRNPVRLQGRAPPLLRHSPCRRGAQRHERRAAPHPQYRQDHGCAQVSSGLSLTIGALCRQPAWQAPGIQDGPRDGVVDEISGEFLRCPTHRVDDGPRPRVLVNRSQRPADAVWTGFRGFAPLISPAKRRQDDVAGISIAAARGPSAYPMI